jgi:hypothetical protein
LGSSYLVKGEAQRGRYQFLSSLRKQGPITTDVDVEAGWSPIGGNHESLWVWAPAFAGATAIFFAETTKLEEVYSAAGALAPAP